MSNLCCPTEDALVERAEVPLDGHVGNDQDGKMGSSTYPDPGGTGESPAQTGPARRTHHEEIRFDPARHTGNVVLGREDC